MQSWKGLEQAILDGPNPLTDSNSDCENMVSANERDEAMSE